MAPLMTRMTLKTQNRRFAGTGGISPENRGVGFLPAFLDQETGRTYLSCNADGSLAPIHRLDGLPDEVILACTPAGRVIAVKSSLVAGFIRGTLFYTREQAATAVG